MDNITCNAAVLSGKPVIQGTRIPVALVLNLFAHGYTTERIIEAYPVLTKEDVMAAVSYAEKMLRQEIIVSSDHSTYDQVTS